MSGTSKNDYLKRVVERVSEMLHPQPRPSESATISLRNTLHCLGFGSFWAWNFCIFWSEIVSGRPQDFISGGSLRVESLIAIAITLVGLAFFAHRLYRNSRIIIIVALITATAGTVLVSFSHTRPMLSIVGFVLVGIAYATQELLWSKLYDDIPQQAVWQITVPGSFIVGIALFLVLELLPN
jgi:hypothetical protein